MPHTNYFPRPGVEFDEDESPIRTAYPVNTLPVPPLPPVNRPGHAGGTIHDPTCSVDLRNVLDVFIK